MASFENTYTTISSDAAQLVSRLRTPRQLIDALTQSSLTWATVERARVALQEQIESSMALIETLPTRIAPVENAGLSMGERWFMRKAVQDFRGVWSIRYQNETDRKYAIALVQHGYGVTVENRGVGKIVLNGDGVDALRCVGGVLVRAAQ